MSQVSAWGGSFQYQSKRVINLEVVAHSPTSGTVAMKPISFHANNKQGARYMTKDQQCQQTRCEFVNFIVCYIWTIARENMASGVKAQRGLSPAFALT